MKSPATCKTLRIFFCIALIASHTVIFATRASAQDDEAISSAPKVKHMIDTHIHLFDTSREKGVPWPPKDDAVLYKPHLPEEFTESAKASGVTGTVIVEASDWIEDNQWVLDLVESDGFYVGLVGKLDLTDKQFKKNLQKLSQDKRLVGIRARVAKSIDFTDAVVVKNVRAMARRNLTLDILPHGISVADCDIIARAVPDVRIVVNHCFAYAADGKPVDEEWSEQVKKLAENKNVYCKVSGLYQHSAVQPAPKSVEHYRLLLDALWDAFGKERLVYGSNWPVTKRSGDYASYVAVVNSYFAERGQEACEHYFWKNAAEAYQLDLK
jgi:L-fuconolactonase